MKRIQYWLRNVFGFSAREISGFSVLTILLVLAVAAPFMFGLISAENPSDSKEDNRRLDSLTAILKISDKENSMAKPDSSAKPESFTLSDFDPNALSSEEWQVIGVQKFLAQRIINYRQKGGKFRIKTDLLKIYGFPADVYTKLAPFILLPDSLTHPRKDYAKVPSLKEETKPAPVKTDKPILSFDLNKADSTQLVQIKGIGPGLSRRIMNYRNKLGGFHDKNQLKEVYGLDSTLVDELLKYGFVTNPVIQKIPVNTATIQELDAHPYVSAKIASMIVDYRKQHGNYTSLESLYQIRALNKETLDKLAPYLSFE